MARTGRGWDAKPPAPRRKTSRRRASGPAASGDADFGPGWDADAAWESDPRTAGALPPPTSAGSGPSRSPRGLPGQSGGAAGDTPSDQHQDGNGPVRSLPWTDKPEGDATSRGGSSRRDDDDPAGGPRSRRGLRGTGQPRGGADDKADEQRDPYEAAREICLRLLAVRPRTRAELTAALKKRGVAREVAREILARYAEVGMIDDTAFAKAWVTSRHHGKGLAGRALAQELRQRGVEQQAVTEALGELDPQTEAQTALELAVRKLRTTRGEPDAVFRKLVGMLARKGYAGGVAVRAVKEALASRDAELAELIDPDVYED